MAFVDGVYEIEIAGQWFCYWYERSGNRGTYNQWNKTWAARKEVAEENGKMMTFSGYPCKYWKEVHGKDIVEAIKKAF